MLTESQSNYLLTIPPEKTVEIKPFSLALKSTGEELLAEIQRAVPELEVHHMGASALGLSGQGDLDIYIFASSTDFEDYLPKLIKKFSEPTKRGETSIQWAFEQNGFPVEMYLTDPSSRAMQEQIRMFELLRDNTQVRQEYEALKASLNGKSFRDYQAAKYEFYNALLGELWNTDMPEEDIIKLAKFLKPRAAILDMGAHEGRHALYLARQGFQVTAVEQEPTSLQKMEAQVRVAKIKMNIVQSSLEDYQTNQLFDAVVCTYVLHFLRDKEAVNQAIEKIQSWTKPEGYAVISAYTTQNPRDKRPYLFAPNELHNAFKNWEIVDYQEKPTPWFIKPGETEIRRNYAVYLMARKPKRNK